MNLALFHFLNQLTHHSAFFDWLVVIIGGYGDVITLTFALLFLAVIMVADQDRKHFFREWTKDLFSIGGTVAIAWDLAYLMKAWVHAPRPFVSFPEIHALLTEYPFDSFPSGHATAFFALATAIYFRNRKAGIFFYGCAILISIGRVIAGIHYPVDILAGAFLGTAIAWILHTFVRSMRI